ncbi:Uncharacterised protein [uncultured archaeon]|nr:Uncharacterised protein [uncultured archaeon]
MVDFYQEITRENIEKILGKDVEEFKLTLKDFPFNSCSLASRRLCKKYCGEDGFRLVYGKYCGPISSDYLNKTQSISENNFSTRISISHNFVYDPKTKLFIDVTANQFHSVNPEILLIPEGDLRICYRRSKINEKTTHYVDNSIFAELVSYEELNLV